MGVIEQVGSLAGTQMAQAVNLAHETFQTRMGEHGHTGRALIETLAHICENHPNLVGIGVGLLVEQFLVHEKHLHEAQAREQVLIAEGKALPKGSRAAKAHAQKQHSLNKAHANRIKPGKVFFEVFGALVGLKFATGVAHVMGRKSHKEAWFAPAAHVRLFSASLAAYYIAKAFKAKDVSAWRNAAIALFATDAIKPVLRVDKAHKAAAARAALAVPPAPPQRLPEPPPVERAPVEHAPVEHAPIAAAEEEHGHQAPHAHDDGPTIN